MDWRVNIRIGLLSPKPAIADRNHTRISAVQWRAPKDITLGAWDLDWLYPSGVQTPLQAASALLWISLMGKDKFPREISAGTGMRIIQDLCCDFCTRSAVGKGGASTFVVADHWKKSNWAGSPQPSSYLLLHWPRLSFIQHLLVLLCLWEGRAWHTNNPNSYELPTIPAQSPGCSGLIYLRDKPFLQLRALWHWQQGLSCSTWERAVRVVHGAFLCTVWSGNLLLHFLYPGDPVLFTV